MLFKPLVKQRKPNGHFQGGGDHNNLGDIITKINHTLVNQLDSVLYHYDHPFLHIINSLPNSPSKILDWKKLQTLVKANNLPILSYIGAIYITENIIQTG